MSLASVLSDCALVGLGGGLGALTRFGVESLPFFEDNKYYYTVGINITGCITIGVLAALFQHWGLPKWATLFVFTGFLGGYTTYSAFTLDAMQCLDRGQITEMILYVLITVFGGLGGCALGLFGTRHLLQS